MAEPTTGLAEVGANPPASAADRSIPLLGLLHALDIEPEAVMARLSAAKTPAPTVAEAIAAYLEWAGSGLGKSPKTVVTYRTGLRRFTEYLAFAGLAPRGGASPNRASLPTRTRCARSSNSYSAEGSGCVSPATSW
jgi:hypothetical protein